MLIECSTIEKEINCKYFTNIGILNRLSNQSNNPPIPTSSSSSFGGASSFFGGAFLSSFLPSSFLVYLGASLATAPELAGADEAAPPKLKKLDKLVPLIALANIFGQYDSTLTPAALTRVLILSAVMS